MALPQTTQYFYFNRIKNRFDGVCIVCRNKQKKRQRAKYKPHAWTVALLRSIKTTNNYDHRLTPDVLRVLMGLQKSRCALTNIPFLLPTEQDLVVNKGYNGWLISLSIRDRLRTPRLVPMIKGTSLTPGNCIFIASYLYDLYQYNGSIADMITFTKLMTPIVYQAEQIYKGLK